MSDNKAPDNPGGRTALVVVGAILVVFGLGNLGSALGLGRMFQLLGFSAAAMRDWMLAFGALAAGILLIVFATRGGTTFRVPTRADRLYRSKDDKMISGVAGGLADYLGMDPTVMRLAIVAIALITEAWPVLLVYIVASVVVPVEPDAPDALAGAGTPLATAVPASAPTPEPPAAPAAPVAPEPPSDGGEPL